MTVYNCECNAAYPSNTLVQLRTRLLRRTGNSATAANPAPGMAALLDDYLAEAQRLVYSDYAYFRTDRWYTWTLVDGERFYDFADGDDEDATCTKRLDPEKIKWIGVSEDGQGWRSLKRGIDPQMYSTELTGIPTRFEIRQCIELWPAPQSGKLRILGNFGLLPFASDSDVTTADPDTIFLRALALYRADKGLPGADNYAELERRRVGTLKAATHQGRRYIPGSNRDGRRGEPGGGAYAAADGVRYLEDGSFRLLE